MCLEVCINTCIDVCKGMCTDMYLDVYSGMNEPASFLAMADVGANLPGMAELDEHCAAAAASAEDDASASVPDGCAWFRLFWERLLSK